MLIKEYIIQYIEDGVVAQKNIYYFPTFALIVKIPLDGHN